MAKSVIRLTEERFKTLINSTIKDDIENQAKYHWVEVSPPLEVWFKELNGNPIPSSLAYKLLHKSRTKITELDDGVHYQRAIGNNGSMETKCIYGFRDERIYEMVTKSLENYCNFKVYDEFKEYANTLPLLNEDVDYLDNHPNREVALAMEIIIQIGNAWDDGIRELTPTMKQYLEASIRLLDNVDDKNSQINGLIRNGNYYLNNMDVLVCHNFDNYIIAPAI